MAAETLNFGPEWLRALSGGGNVASPPPSPAMPKYKLADYRYGREEMLALYVKENKVPEELQDKEFTAVLQEEPLQPLALEPLTEEEQKGPKEPIPEEQELDFQGLEEEEEEPSEGVDEEGPEAGGKEVTPLPPPEKSSSPSPLPALGPLWTTNEDGDEVVEKEPPPAEGDEMRGLSLSPGVGSPPGPPGDLEDEEGLKHLQQEAEKLVASLQDSSLEEEQFTAAMQTQGLRHSTAATALPLSHGAARKWFYKDPQGEIQGPFTTQEMAEWFQAGYFSMSLLVKRGCDEGFQPLGEVIKMWGRVPFAPGPSPPPLLGNMDQERLKKQQELAAAALYQQLQHQHFLQLVGRCSGLIFEPLTSCHLQQLGGLGTAPLNQWVSEAGPLWGGPDKSGGSSSGSLGLWEDTVKSGGNLARNLGLKNSRSSPSLSDSYSHLSGRPVRKKTEEEEKLLKLLQGIPRPQDGFTQWCEQMLHTLSTTGSLDVPMAVAILKEVESPYDVHDYIRSCLGDTLEAKEFAKQFLERRAKQKASQQRQQQQQEAWLSSTSLQTAFQANHSTKLGPGEGSKAKRRALMLHSDPSILGYSLHGPSGEIESVDDY
ncbi:PERQ amino acid-rich with GYF domain-containing protein 1 [Cricetulus griseus]|uniref:PERQ amino acid-rich with GYF domain-containing protein 1 n=1 Tax=Cricetulus griseus TaxID=10029 RepID=A0A061I532_CRIGR|nr:PERQ amino acid-rich with GYF domain-containing protein 1 [Cricetulus griseus]